MDYFEYQFGITPKEPWTEILLALLDECGFESFIENEQGLQAFVPIHLDDEVCVKSRLDVLKDAQITYQKTEVKAQNWNAVWESNFKPILIDDTIYIHADFHPEKKEIPYAIKIQPKMAFGTGHHETTALVLSLMKDMDFQGKKVLDMGCGTGILGIFAKMKGANYVEAIDYDEWATDNSTENAQKNQVEMTVKLGETDQISPILFDVIVANINKNILLKQIPDYFNHLKKDGILILSGLMIEDEKEMSEFLSNFALEKIETKAKKEWIALLYQKTS